MKRVNNFYTACLDRGLNLTDKCAVHICFLADEKNCHKAIIFLEKVIELNFKNKKVK